MQPIDEAVIVSSLQGFEGSRVYLHFEFPVGGFVRNVSTTVSEAHLKGTGPYRVALRCEGDGWVMMEGLTHAVVPENGPLFLCALEEDGRLNRALQISRAPFAA